MFRLPIVSHPFTITGQIVISPAPKVIKSVARRLFGVELWETGARMRAQSTVGVCIKLLLSTVVHIFEEKTNSGLRVLWDGLFRPLFLPFTHTSRFCPIVTLMGFLTQKKFANNHSFVTRLQ